MQGLQAAVSAFVFFWSWLSCPVLGFGLALGVVQDPQHTILKMKYLEAVLTFWYFCDYNLIVEVSTSVQGVCGKVLTSKVARGWVFERSRCGSLERSGPCAPSPQRPYPSPLSGWGSYSQLPGRAAGAKGGRNRAPW